MGSKETGRTMLEMIAVIVLIILLSIGSLMGYKQVVARHQATVLHQDIMVEASSRRGDNAQKKSTYDSGLGSKTRQGLAMKTERSSDTFTIIVKEVSAALCSSLKKKDWDDALRIKINGNVYKPYNPDNPNDPNQIQCPSGDDNFDLSLIFPYKVSAIEAYQDFCRENSECMSCQTCNTTTGTCQNDCETGTCIAGACVGQACEEGETLVETTCQPCKTDYSATCSSCNSTTPYWNGTDCVCHDNSCGTNFYCDTNGACQECETPSESCVLSEDKLDNTTQCLITKKISCADPNPDCNITTGECMHCDAPIQRCDRETATDPTTGCTTIKKITCDSSANPACRSSGNCGPCPNNATCNNGTITCKDGYYRNGDECQKCDDPKTSCKFAQNTTDENGCITEKETTCGGETPACYDDGVCRKCPDNSGLTEQGPEISGSPCKCKSGYAYDEAKEKCVKDACGGNACCLEMLSLGFDIDPDCTNDTCRTTKDKTKQKSGTFFMETFSTGARPFYLGNMTLDKDVNLEKCSTLFVKGNLDVQANLQMNSLDVNGTFTIHPNKNVTLGQGWFNSTIIESGGVLKLTNTSQASKMGHDPLSDVWEEILDGGQFINKGTVESVHSLYFPKTFENYGKVTISGNILQNNYIGGHSVDSSFLNNGTIEAENLGEGLTAANTSVINNGTLTLRGALGVSDCHSANGKCGVGLTNSGMITATALEGRFLSNTGGTITISGDVVLGNKNTSADTAIDISGGSVNITGNLVFYTLNTGIKLSGQGQLTVDGNVNERKGQHTLSEGASGPFVDISDNAQLVTNGSDTFHCPFVSKGPAIKVSGNGKIKSKQSIYAEGQYPISQTGGQILVCDQVTLRSLKGNNITGGVLASTSSITSVCKSGAEESCKRIDYLSKPRDTGNADSYIYDSHVKPYASIPWCRSSGTCNEGYYESDGICVACEATFEKICPGCPDKSKPYWNGTECTEAQPCTDNTDCKKGEYCHYYELRRVLHDYGGEYTPYSCRNGPDTNSGVCLTAAVASGTNDYGFTLSANEMNWVSAEKFCESLNKTMVSLEDTDCTTRGCDWSKTATGNLSSTYWWWAKDLHPSDFCFAFYVKPSEFVSSAYRFSTGGMSALCR